jgi:hypothetical protein
MTVAGNAAERLGGRRRVALSRGRGSPDSEKKSKISVEDPRRERISAD